MKHYYVEIINDAGGGKFVDGAGNPRNYWYEGYSTKSEAEKRVEENKNINYVIYLVKRKEIPGNHNFVICEDCHGVLRTGYEKYYHSCVRLARIYKDNLDVQWPKENEDNIVEWLKENEQIYKDNLAARCEETKRNHKNNLDAHYEEMKRN